MKKLPAVLVAEVALVMTGTVAGGGFTVRVNARVPVPPAFVAPSTSWKVPDCVGVPERMPVAVFSVTPPGSVPETL